MIKNLLLLVAALLLYGRATHVGENNWIKLITDLNENLHIQWNLIIMENDIENNSTKEFEDFLKTTQKSILILAVNKTQENHKKAIEEAKESQSLSEIYGYNVMTIVYFNGRYNRYDLKFIGDYVANILKNLHFTTVLWYFQTDSVKEKHLYFIAKLAWSYGFTKVLYYVKNQVYTFNPLPVVEIKKLSSLKEFYNLKDISDYQRYPLKFPITSSPPRCYRYRDAQGNWAYAGYFYEILITFVQQYNFKFMEYSYDYEDNDNEALLDLIATYKVDFLPLHIYRNRACAASDVLWNSRIIPVVPNAKPIEKFKYFEKPFKPQIWCLYITLIIMISLCIGFVRYCKTQRIEFSKVFLYVLSTSIYQSHTHFKRRCLIAKSFHWILVIYGFIMIQMYLCKLSSLLALTIYESQIQSVDDLNRTDLKAYVSLPDIQNYASLPEVSPVILERMIVTDGIDLDDKRRSLSPLYFHLGFEDKLNFFLTQQKYLKVPLVRKIDVVLVVDPIFFTMRHNLPYVQLFNRYLKYMAQSGLLSKIMNDLECEGIMSGQIKYFKEAPNDNEHLLTLEYFYSSLNLYAMGVMLSFCVFVGEILYFKLFRHKYSY